MTEQDIYIVVRYDQGSWLDVKVFDARMDAWKYLWRGRSALLERPEIFSPEENGWRVYQQLTKAEWEKAMPGGELYRHYERGKDIQVEFDSLEKTGMEFYVCRLSPGGVPTAGSY